MARRGKPTPAQPWMIAEFSLHALLAIFACSSFALSIQLQDPEPRRHLQLRRGVCISELDPRPHVHFTPNQYWMNDPNGLVYYQDEYHLFFQASLGGKGQRKEKSWGHAVSKDLMHWQELQTALAPDEEGFIWSGSTVVDWRNVSGLQLLVDKPPLIAFYTNMPPGGALTTQRIAVSHDNGRTWNKQRKPVIAEFPGEQARDPKVQWHEASNHWIMVLYLRVSQVLLYRSKNLLDWEKLQDIGFKGAFECPDFFELPVAGDKDGSRYWVLMMGDARYQVGTFDGRAFKSLTGVQYTERGVGYAAATFNEEPNGRRVQISWLRPNWNFEHPLFASTPFTGAMALPMQLDLVKDSSGIYVRRSPVSELDTLRIEPALIASEDVGLMQSNPSSGAGGLDVLLKATVPSGKSMVISIMEHSSNDTGAMVRLQAEGKKVVAEVIWKDLGGDLGRADHSYSADEDLHRTVLNSSEWNSTAIPLKKKKGAGGGEERVSIRVVVDWGTIEVFDMVGGESMALYVPRFGELIATCAPLRVEASNVDTGVKLHVLKAYELQAAMR